MNSYQLSTLTAKKASGNTSDYRKIYNDVLLAWDNVRIPKNKNPEIEILIEKVRKDSRTYLKTKDLYVCSCGNLLQIGVTCCELSIKDMNLSL